MVSGQAKHTRHGKFSLPVAVHVSETDAPSVSAPSEPQRSSLPSKLDSRPPECGEATTNVAAQAKTDTATQSPKVQSIKECCKQCDYTASDFKTLKSHVWKRHHIRIHRCRDCRHISYDETYEASHRSQSCQFEGRYLCEPCDQQYTDFHSWHKHDIKHPHDNGIAAPDRLIRCCYCRYKSSQRREVIRHQARHTDDDYKIRCPYCAWGCDSHQKVMAHIRSFHDGR